MVDHIIADCFIFFQRLSFELKIIIIRRPRRELGTRDTMSVESKGEFCLTQKSLCHEGSEDLPSEAAALAKEPRAAKDRMVDGECLWRGLD